MGIVLADSHNQMHFIAASNESGRDMETLQLQDAEGPCQDCYTTGKPVTHADLSDGTAPWPTFAPRAVREGIRSVHAFPMRLREQTIGALNLFGRTPGDFDDADSKIVQALADVATIAILHERNTSRAEAVSEQLQGALTSRVIIEQAKGMFAHSDKTTVHEAFTLLRDEARRSRRKVTDVAAEVLAQPRPAQREPLLEPRGADRPVPGAPTQSVDRIPPVKPGTFSSRYDEEIKTLFIRGEVDDRALEQIRQSFRVLASGDLTVDLHEVVYLPSGAIGVLLRAQKNATSAGGQFDWSRLPGRSQRSC